MIGSMPSVADLIISRLRSAGVEHLFGVPGGGSNLDLIEAAGRHGLPFVLTATENGAAIAALAQAEVTGRPGACLTTLGPGATSVVNGVACASLERAPLIVFTDSHPEVFAHQRIDHRALMAPIVRWSARLGADGAAAVIDRAIAIATAPPAGPVHVDCPGDVAAATADESPGAAPSESGTTPSRQPVASIGDAARLAIAAARKPLIVVGLGSRSPADRRAVLDFCERRQIPAMVTYKAKGVIPDSHPLFAGIFTNAAIEQNVVDESDLLIGIGLDPVELIPRTWVCRQPIVYVGRHPVEDDHVPFAAQAICEIPASVAALDDALGATEWEVARIRDLVEAQRARIAVAAAGLSPQDVVMIAARRCAPLRVTIDAGAHMFPATMLWPVDRPNGMLISNGLSTMGFALPAAIGAALLERERPVVALTGDGGLLMCAAELLTAVRERLRIVLIVFSDGSLSLIEIKQRQRRYHPAGVALGALNWPALAAGFGAAAACAATEAELCRAIDQALAHPGPTLIEARVDGSSYARTLAAVRG